jgi:hypothetical protein
VVSARENIHPVFLQVRQVLGNRPFAISEVFRIGDNEVRRVFRSEPGQVLGEQFPSLPSENIAENEEFHIVKNNRLPDFPQDFFGMSGGSDASPFLEERSGGIEQETRTEESEDHFAVQVFFSHHAELFDEAAIVGNEGKPDAAAALEMRVGFRVVLGYADDPDALGREFCREPREILAFEGATGSVVLRVEIQEGPGAFFEDFRKIGMFDGSVRSDDLASGHGKVGYFEVAYKSTRHSNETLAKCELLVDFFGPYRFFLKNQTANATSPITVAILNSNT